MARIYANENFPQPVVEEPRRLGHDVLTVLEAGKAGMAETDEAVLAYACSESRVLLTLNRKHFVRLHSDHPDHAGIVVCSLDPDFAGQAHRIHTAIEAEDELRNKLLRVNRP
ncbi:MAG: DUF5615 family PIN-like protein [Armatimonadetes bacterium]|nr:DUF5615 family PIN-like protein [Armatimonadota bacterium]